MEKAEPLAGDRLLKVRALSSLILVLSLSALVTLLRGADGTGMLLGHYSWQRLVGTLPSLLLGGTALGVLLATLSARLTGLLFAGIDRAHRFQVGWRWLAGMVFAVLPFVYLYLQWGPFWDPVIYIFPRAIFFGYMVLLGSVCLQAIRPSWSIAACLAAALLVYGLVYELAVQVQQVSAYPLSWGWSETSRFYYASLFRSRQIYGSGFPLPFLHPSRYLLQAVPFLVSGLPLWAHRLWQALLWIGVTGAAALLLERRLRFQDRRVRFLFAAWAFLFFFQGPVYYHLMVCVLLVLLGFNRDRSIQTLVFVLAASLWAGISRVNWYPVPGLLAAALYFLEVRVDRKPFWRYLLPPAAWSILGTGCAFLAQAAYRPISGNPAFVFDTSFQSPLLWYRLLPNPTYPLGILLALALAAFPALLYLILKVGRLRGSWNPVRLLGLGAILGVLLVEGVLVSLKIGGGSNLHNLDAFLVLLAVTGGYVYAGRFETDRLGKSPQAGWSRLGWAAVLIPPVLIAVQLGGPFSFPDPNDIKYTLTTLQRMVDEARPGEVLFISQRHLVTFDQIKRVALVPEYEKVDLMEMAMASSEQYLGSFRADLQSRRFKLIITDPFSVEEQGMSGDFSEENNAWVEHVDRVLNRYYKPKQILDGGIEVLEPR